MKRSSWARPRAMHNLLLLHDTSSPETGALISRFGSEGSTSVDCSHFMVRFLRAASTQKSDLLRGRRARQKRLDERAAGETAKREAAKEGKNAGSNEV